MIKNIGNESNNLITKYHWIFLIFTVVIAFICFDQAFDMKITMLHGVDFLKTVFDGQNFCNFYNYTIDKSLAGEYIRAPGYVCGAIYNIILYIAMGLISLPVLCIKFFVNNQTFIECLNIWGRLVMIAMSVFSAYLIFMLCKKLGINKEKTNYSVYLFLSSPILIFGIVIFNQYDIISVMLTVISLFCFLDKKYYKFSFIISFAICFKLFALFIFIPLILLVEKRLLKIFNYIMCGISLYGITTLFCMLVDSGYDKTQKLMMPHFNFFDKVVEAQVSGAQGNISIFILCFLLISVIAYFYNAKDENTPIIMFLIIFFVYGIFFSLVSYHPQWEIIILPSIVFLVIYSKDLNKALIFDIVISMCFIIINSIKFLDYSISSETILSKIVQMHFNKKIFYFIKNIFENNNIMNTTLNTVFVAGILGMLILTFLSRHSQNNSLSVFTDKKEFNILLIIRSLIIWIYMLPPILSIFIK